jgi:hypothetical protein
LFQLFSNIEVQESQSCTNFDGTRSNLLEHRGLDFECAKQGENTLSSLKIVVTSIIFMQLIFLVLYGHHILDFFCFKYILLALDNHKLDLICNSIRFNLLFERNPMNIEELEYVFDKIILSQSLKICAYISKLGLWVELFGEFFFMVNDMDIH